MAKGRAERKKNRADLRLKQRPLARWGRLSLEALESRLAPTTGILALDDLSLTPADRTLIQIGGLQVGNPPGGNDSDGYDRLQVANTASLDGTLQLSLVNNFIPAVGAEFEILTAGTALSGAFHHAEGLFSIPGGDRYFRLVQEPHTLKLVVTAAPGGLTFTPATSARDSFGEFLNDDYFHVTQFTYTGTISAPRFVDLAGTFAFEDRGSTVVAGSSDAAIFLGTAYGASNQTGLQLSDAQLGLVLTDTGHAMTASGSSAFVGLAGLNIAATFDVQTNTTGQAVHVSVPTPAGSVVVQVDAEDDNGNAPRSFAGTGTISVSNQFTLEGDIALTEIATGMVLVDVTDMQMSLTTGDLEVFRFGGLVRFGMDHHRGFQLLDTSFNDVHVLGVDVLPGASSVNSLTYPDDELGPVQFTSLFDAVDVAVLNRRRYLDLTFQSPTNQPIDPDSILDNDPEFLFSGSAFEDAVVDYVVQLDTNTFRYYLIDGNTSNAADSFKHDLFRVNENFSNTRLNLNFIANSWKDTDGVGNAATVLGIDVRSGITVTSSDVELGPLVLKGPFFNVEELQFKPLANPADGATLVTSVAVGVDEASLKFGGDSPKLKTGVTGLLGTFGVETVVTPAGIAGASPRLRVRVDKVEVEIKDVVKASATGVYVTFDPLKDRDHDGIVSSDEQTAYNQQEIVRVDSASVEIPKINLTGSLNPYTRPSPGIDPNTGQVIPGTTIPGLSVRNDGFRLGEASLHYAGDLSFGGMVQIKGVAAGVQDLGVTFGQEFEFDGAVFIAADEAILFPGKKFEMKLTDGPDSDSEAVRTTLKFTDNLPSGFAFKVDTGDLKFGNFLTVHASNFEIDTTNTPPFPVVNFGSLAATISAGPLKLGGEIRDFGFLNDGTIRTGPAFGVFVSVDKVDGKSFQWPDWLPIRPTEFGIQWRDLQNHPEEFKLIVSAAVESIKGLPKLDFSGSIQGIEIDVGLLQQGQFPITGIESMGVSVSGDLFGGKVNGGLIGGIIKLDSTGAEISPLDQITPIADRVFFLGVEGGFTISGQGGFTLRFALTEKGPLGVQVTGDLPEGILLEPISGLKLSGFSGGVEFFKSLPDAYKPEDLLDPNFAPALTNASKLDADQWLQATRRQVIAQYNSLKENPVAGGFLAAFRNPLLISGGGQIVFHTPESVLKINAEVRISVDPNLDENFVPLGLPKVKLLLTGDILLFGGLQRSPARIFADLSKIEDGTAKLLLMAQDIPAGTNPLLLPVPIPMSLELRGAVSLKYFGPNGEEVDFYDDTPTPTSPTAQLIDPAQDGQISQGKLSQNRYVDVQFSPSPDATLDAASITDADPELVLVLPDGTRLTLGGAAVHPEGAAENVYRFTLPGTLAIDLGEYEIRLLPGSWQDSLGQQGAEQLLRFAVVGATVELAGPTNNDRIDRAAIHQAGRLAIRFQPTPGAVLDLGSILDAAPEVALTGPASAGVSLGQPVRDLQDDLLFYYPFTGTFGVGPVGVTLLDGAWTDSQGNVSGARSFAFTVTGPEVRLRDPADGTTVAVAELNQRGYLEVYFTPSGGVAVDPVSLTDAAPEFVLSGAGAGVSVSGVAVPVPGEPNVYRYALLSAFTQAGAVTVEFLGGSFQDLQGVASASRTESFRLEGVAAHLVSPAPFSTAGVTLLNSRGYLDVRFTPTAGATLDEAAILDAAAEFTLEGLAAADVVIDGAPTPLGNGLYRYAFTGVFQPGAVTLRWIASAAADSAGFLTTPRADTFRLEVPAVELASPSDRLRVDRSKINDAGYIDVRFLDRTGRGLAEASITDADAEFQLLVLDESGQNWIVHPQVGVNGAALRNPDGSYRYFFSNAFNPGVVRVQFLEGSFTDVDGAANLAAEQQFVVVNNAPSFEFQIEGHLVYRTGFKSRLFGDLSNPDQVRDLLKMLEPIVGEIGGNDEAGMQALRDFVAGIDTGLSIIQPFLTQPLITLDGFIRFGSEMLVGPASEILGARTTLDISGAIGVYLLGPVGAAAGRIVLQVDGHGINVWGVAELRAELKVLRKAGIDLQAFGVLQFNTTGVEQVESLTLKGMGPNGSDLTQTYQIEPYSLMVAAAGKMIFSVPTFNDAAPFGQEMFRINAVASLNISSEGLAMFVKGDLEIGPPDVRLLDIDALGVFIINDQGFAGDVQVSATVGDIPALKDYLQLDVSARVVFNVTGQAQQVKILDRFLDFLTPEFKALLVDIENPLPPGYTQTFANTATKAYVVPAAPPPPPVDDGTPAPAGPYIVIAAQGNLMVGGAFRLHGDFYFEVNATPEMFVTLNGSIALDPLGAAAISGTFHIDRHGAYGGLQIGASLDVGPLSVFGAAQFEFNTQAIPAQVARYRFDFDRGQVTDEREIVTLGPGAFRIHVAGHLKLANSFDLQGQFLLENQPDIIAVHIDAKFDAFGANLLTVNGDAAIVKTGATGFVANLAAQAQAPFALDGVFEMQANFLLQINTRTGNAQDAYDLGLARDSFLVRFDGSLNLLSVLELSGSGFIEYKLGVFRMQVAMQTSFFGLASLSASGFFSSEGEFDLYLGGSFSIGAPGFLGVQAGGNIHISLLDSNGTEAFGDGNTVLRVNGGLGGTFWVFGFSFGANVGVNFASDTGVLSITPSITINLLFFSITHSTTFNLGVLKVNPPVYVAGNADDTFGQAFRGGALYLNMGPRAALRNYDVTETGEHFSIEYVGPDPDQGGHIVRVTGNGLRRTYRGVTEIIADGGTGRDLIETDAALPVPVTFRGGAENDRLLHRGSGPAFLQGGDGQDEIETHANVGPVFLDGGGDSDTLRHLGTAPATLVGGFGDDTIQGGLGDDRFVFAEGYGYDLLTDAGGIATLDFDTAVSSLHGSLTTAGALINGSSTTRLHSADAFVRVDDGSELLGPTYAPVRLVHDGGHRLVVQHAGHPFAEGDEIEIATPDSILGTALRTKARWRITEVTAAGYVLELPADQTNRGVVAKVYYYDDAGVSRSRDTVILHDGNRTATVYHPDHPVAVGDTIYLVSPEASYYNGEFTVTAVGADWYALDVPFDLVRDSASTDFGVANLVLGLGDDRIDTDVAQAVETTLTDRRFGKDEVFVSGPFPSAVTLEAGRFLASDLRLTFAEGIDRLTLFSPTQALTLNSATGTADLGALGLRVVADLVDLNTAIDAGHLVLESRATITVDHPVNVSHDGYIDLRVFGDSADIVLEQPLTVSTGDSQDGLGDGWIRLLAPDGSITGSQALSFVAPNSHLIYKAKNAPTGTLQTHLEKLTFAYGPHGTPGDVSIVEQDGLILTSLDDYDTPFAPDLVYGDGTFAGITWLTTAPAGWLDQMRGGSTPGGSSPFALVVPAGALRLQLLAEDSLLYLESGQITTQAAGQDMTFLADDVSFRSGAAQVIGTGRLSIQANQAVWNYRLGTAGENAAGSDLLRSAFARSMDLTSGDLAALADGFAQITIGRSDAGNTMVLGDAMDAEFIKFTGQERLRDARFRDPTLLLTDTLTVAGDVEATGTLEIRAAGSAVVEGPNLHVPTGGIDSGLEALQLILQVGQDLQVNGWLLAAALLDVAVHGEVTIDVGARLETRNDDNTFRLDAGGNLSIAGEVKAGGLRGKPQLNADGAIYLREGGSISAPGAGAQIDIQSDVRVTMEPGTAVLAGVTFDHSTGSPIPTVTGAGSSVRIRSPQELFLPGTVAASDGITLEGGPSTLDYSAYFQSRFPSEHPLHARSHYAILVTGTLLTFGDARDLVLSSTDDVIISGNIDLRGAGSNLILQSDRSLFVEGFTTLASGNITLYGGVALDGTDRVGADETSVTVYEGSLLTTGNASSRIDVRGATNIALLGSLVAGGTVTSTGIHWASPGDAAITVRAGQQIHVAGALQASRSVTLEGGTPGADAAGLSVVITPTGGLNAAGLSADAQATGEVRITAAGDLEMMGRIVSGATLIESGGTTTFDWSGATRRASDVTLVATGRAYLGGNTVNSVGDPITVGGFIHSARSITLAGGTHASGTGLLIHPNSELSTHGAAGSIDLTSQQDAEVRGRIASGGEIVQGVVTLFDGEATVRIEAAHQVRISREVAASQGVTIIGGIDPIEADPLSGHSVVVAGTGLLRTSAANAVVEIRGPQSITLLSPLDLTAYNVQAPGAGSRITIASGDRLTIGGRLQSYRDITLNGLSPTTGDPTEGSTVELTETSLLETINGSITFDAGSSGLVRGSLTAGGTGSDITIHGAANDLAIQGHLKAANAIVLNIPGDLDVSGDLLAGNRIALTAGGVLTLRSTSDVATTAAHAVVALTAQGTILLDGAVGGHATASTNDPAAMPYAAESLSTTTVESQAGNVTLTAASGRLQAGAALTVQGGLIELAGVVRTTSATAAPGSFDVLFDSRGLLQITGDIDVAGSLLAMSPTLVTVSDGTLRVSGNHRLRIEAPQVTVGTADAGGMVASGGSLEIAATDVGLRSGTQLLATGNNSLVRIDADYLDVAGSIRAGADLNTASALVWTGTSADVDLHVREMLTLTGSIRATGAIDIAVLGGSAAVGYSSGAFSTVQTDATGSGALTATNPSSITIITDRDLHLDGSVLASDDGADISLDVGKLLKIDGFVQADDALRLSAGEDQSSLSIYLRGTLNTGIGGSITLTAPKQILLEGAIGQYRPEGNNAVIDVGSVTITTSAALDVRGPLLAQHQVDLAATQINVLSSGVIRVSNTDGKVEARAVENLLVAAGGQVLSSGSIHLFGTNVRVNGIVENDNGSETPRVLLNAVESVVVAGTVTSKGDLHLNAGVGAAWSLAQLTGAIASADLTGGLVRVEGAGKLSATGTVKAAAGEDIELQADPEAPGVQRPVLTPTLSMLPQTIDVVVGHRQVAAGVVYTPLVRWVDTRVEMQTGVEQVKSGNYFHTMDVTLTQDGYYNGVTKREYFIHGIDYANSLAEQQNNAPVIDWAGDAPAAGATFNQLSDAQRAIVLAALGYLPLFDFSYANAQEHRTQQGSTSVVPWTPYWSTAASHIVQMALPGLEGKYIRLPIDAELDLVRVVTQGVPTTSTETVGSFSETAVVRYDQDRSRYTGFDDLDRSAERFAVSYVGDGRRTYTVIDGSGGTVNTPPVWGTSVDTEVGVDALGKLVLAPLGFLPTTASLTSLGLVLVRPDQRVIDPSTNLRLQFEPDAKTIYDFVPYPSIPLASGFRTAAPADAALRGGQVAVILSAEDNYWADQASPDDQLVLLGFYAYPTDGINYFIAFYDQTRITYTNWAPGQPDQLNAAGSAGEFDVVTIGASGLWYDIVNFATGGMINSGYLLQRSAVETFYDYTFNWTSQAHVLQDTRLTLGYQWVSNTHDLFTEVPVVELVDAKVAVVDQVPSTSWVAQPITEQQTVLRPTRVMVPGAATEVAVFSGDSLASESAIVLDAGRDVTLSGLVTAKNAAGTAGAISIDAGRNFYMTGAKPAGADETMQAATAGMSAVSRIAITAAGTFTLAESISITAADENAADSTSNAIVVTAGDSAIIRGTLSTTNTRIGEVTVRAGDEIELKGEIVSGHVVNVFAGTDGVGGISSDIYGRIKTLGSEVHLTAGSLGGDIVLTDLFIETAGPFEILAPAGSITNTGGLLQAGSLKVFARDGADLGFVEVGAVDAEVTGAGGIKLYAFGSISLDRLVTANGPIDITGTGNVEFGNVLPGGPNGTLRVDPLTTVSGNVPFADPLYLNVAGGTTITTATSELHLNVVSPGNVTVHHTGDGALTVYATVANGSLTIDTGGDLIIIDVEVLTNLDGRELTLVAGGDVIVGRIVAGAYAATAADSAAIRTTLGLAEDTLLTSLTSVSIQAGGAIRQLAAGDPDVDIIAGSLTLKAGTGIPGLELAVNQLTEVTTTTGPITLTDVDSVGEISQGLDVVQVRANEGTVTITAAGSLLVGSVTAGGALHLTSSAGGFELRDHDPLPAALSSTGITSIHAGAQVFLTGPVTTGGLVVDAQGAVQITQAIAAVGSVSIVSHQSHLMLGADIQVRANGTLDELLLAAQGNLNLAGRTLPTVTSRLSLTAGAEMIFSLAQPALIVTGANGELTITAGGDLVFLSETLLQADHLALASTGYIDADGTAHGGHLWVIGSPRGATSPTPRTVSLAATNGLHLHQGVTAAEVLRLAGGEVSLSRTGSLRLFEELAIANGVNDPTVLAAVAGSVGFLSAPTIEIAGGTTLRFDQGTHFEDQLRTTHPIVLLDGIIVLDVSASADETTAITPGAALPLTFTGSGGLTKRGAGTFELATTNTFTGPLQVEGGTLLLTGSTSASTSVTVTNATLAGTGTLVGPLTIGNGGHLIVGTAPNQIATFRTGALVFQTGSHLYLDLNATQRDALIVTGSITIHHDAAVTVIGLDGFVMPEAYTRYTLVHNDTSADAVIGRFQHITTRNDLGVELIAGILHTGGDGNDLDLESGLDYGDAPAGYPVLLADNGARHVILGPKLGNLCNVESEGAPSASASSDPGDDGVTFLTTLVSSAVSPTVASLTVDLENAGASNLLDAWIDFNQDGDWDDVGEQIFASVALGTTSGRTTLSFTLPAGASVGTTFARFRLSSAGHLLPTGFASDGEVEDYQVTIVPSGSPASVTLPSGGTTTVDVASGQLRVRQHGITLFQAPAPAVGALAVHGSDADDNTLALDFSTGNPVPAGGITFHGGTGGNDALVLLRGASTGLFDTITHTFTSPTSGSAALDPDGPNGAAASWISYSGVEGASDSLDALHRALQFAGGDESITLADASGASMTVRSTAGTPLTFANPASHLTLDAGDGDDSVTILSLDTDGPFDAGLTLEGGEGSDAIRLEAALTPAAHHSVAFTAESIAVLAPIATTGSSSIHLLAGQALTLGASLSASADVTLAATTGSITGAGNDGVDVQANSLSADAATGIDLNTQVTSLTATTRGAGSITIDEADALVLTDVTAANGAIRITTGGALVVGKVASTTDQDDNAIVLQARTGNVTVGTINTTPHLHGDVRVEALQGAILDDQSDATGILADELFLAAMLGLGEAAVSGQLDFDAVKLITHTEGGNAHQYLGEANDVAFLRGDAGAGTLYLVNGTYRLGAGDDNLANASGVHLASQVALELQDESEAIGSLAGEIGATLRLGLGTLTTGASNASTTFAGTITGSGGITKVGAGIFTLTGANTYAGLTTLKEGTLSVRTSANLGNGSATNDLVFQGGTLRTTGSFTTGREVKLSAPGATLDTAAGTSLALTGLITGSGTLTKTGAGTLVLVGNNRHAGPTTITAGQLQVNGRSSLGTLTTATASVKRGASLINHGTIRGNVHVDAGATLRGRGRILGNTIVRGNLRPGDASRPGVLTLGANSGKQLHLSGTAHFRINGAQHDSITTNARVTLSGRLLLTFGAAPVAGAQITMIRNQSQRPILGTFQGLPEGAILTIGPARVQITYRGGASQRDVVLRVLTGRRINR